MFIFAVAVVVYQLEQVTTQLCWALHVGVTLSCVWGMWGGGGTRCALVCSWFILWSCVVCAQLQTQPKHMSLTTV